MEASLVCWLITAAVLGCDPRAAAYERAAAEIPTAHWALVRGVSLTERPGALVDVELGELVLPAEPRPSELRRAVGRLVAASQSGEPARLWDLVAWSQGRPRWQTPSSWAESSPAADLADSYRALLEGELERCCAERARLLHVLQIL